MKNLKSKLGVFKTKTAGQSIVTFGGTFVNGILGALFFIVTARFLGPEKFGLLTVATMVMTLTSDVFDLGTDTGLVRFIGEWRNKDKQTAFKYLKLGFEIKFVVGVFVSLVGYLGSDYISYYLFSNSELSGPLEIAFLGVFGLLMFSFIIHSLQGYERFWWWSGIQVVTNAMRLLLVFIIFSIGAISLESVFYVYIAMPVLGFLAGLFLLPRGFFKVKNEGEVFPQFFSYNKWVAAFTILSAVSAKLDTFISARLLTSYEVGIYSAANRLTQIMPQVVGALATVIGPKMASQNTFSKFKAYFYKTQIMVSGISVLAFLAIPLGYVFIPILFGEEYKASFGVFVILLIAMIIFLFSVPVHQAVFYYFSYPKLFWWVSVGYFLIISGGGYFLISNYGVYGAGYTVLLGSIFNFVAPAIYVYRKIREGK